VAAKGKNIMWKTAKSQNTTTSYKLKATSNTAEN
jgi:hypothetical protein